MMIVPQVLIQPFLYIAVFGDERKGGIKQSELLISLISPKLNSIVQICKLYLESGAVKQNVIEYSLQCITGRIGWVPFQKQIESLSRINNNSLDSDGDSDNATYNTLNIDYNIKYRIPLITKCLGMKNSIEFDFSSVTIRYAFCFFVLLSCDF